MALGEGGINSDLVVPVGEIGFQDKEVGKREDALELKKEPLMPHSIECLFDIEEHRGADLFPLKGGSHRVHHTVALMDRGMKGPETKLVGRKEVLDKRKESF